MYLYVFFFTIFSLKNADKKLNSLTCIFAKSISIFLKRFKLIIHDATDINKL